MAPTVPEPAAPESGAGASGPSRRTKEVLGATVLICGLFAAMLGVRGIDTASPVTTESGTIDSIDMVVTRSARSRPQQRYELSGRTESGDEWATADKTAYEFARSEGCCPLPVQVSTADWTGNVVELSGEGWVARRTSGAAGAAMAAGAAALAAISLGALVAVARRWSLPAALAMSAGLILVAVIGAAMIS